MGPWAKDRAAEENPALREGVMSWCLRRRLPGDAIDAVGFCRKNAVQEAKRVTLQPHEITAENIRWRSYVMVRFFGILGWALGGRGQSLLAQYLFAQCLLAQCLLAQCLLAQSIPEPLSYQDDDLVVDLGVGLWAWPLPMDYDGDGDLDLVVVCPDKPYNGTYFFENAGRSEAGDVRHVIFEPAVKLDRAVGNPQLSWLAGEPRVLTPEKIYPNFAGTAFQKPTSLPIKMKEIHPGRVRANQWKLADLDGDEVADLVVGVGDWTEYGWDNAFDSDGEWQNGPLHGWVYWAKNEGTSQEPKYGKPVQLLVGQEPLDVYGMPSPNFADWDQDGDLDLLCGEFLDGFTYFENRGTRHEPRFGAGVRLEDATGEPLKMDLQMIVPVTVDWDGDGDFDLVCGDEDGRVAFLDCLGVDGDGVPKFAAPHYFQQQARHVKFGALVTPWSVDWDRDGDEDLICGNTAGYVAWIENLDGGKMPRWAPPKKLLIGDQPLRLQAGPKGSIQGPCEAKWGYSTLSVADWDHDGQWDLIVNGIWGKVLVFRGVKSDTHLQVREGEPVQVAWPAEPPKPAWNWWKPGPTELSTQWRTTPVAVDWNLDGLHDLVMLDHEGFLVLFERKREGDALVLQPGRRIFKTEGPSVYDSRNGVMNQESGYLRLNGKSAGGSGRRKFCLGDWDHDGQLDLLVNSVNIDWFKGMPLEGGEYDFENQGAVTSRILAGHTTSPTLVDWNRDGLLDLLIGAEDGFLYYLPNPATEE
jgi:hypothetical protein